MLFTVLFLSRCSSRHFLVLFQFLHQVVFVIPALLFCCIISSSSVGRCILSSPKFCSRFFYPQVFFVVGIVFPLIFQLFACIVLSSIVAYRNGFPTIVVFPMNVRGYCPSPMLLALRVLVSPCIVGYDIYSYFCGDWWLRTVLLSRCGMVWFWYLSSLCCCCISPRLLLYFPSPWVVAVFLLPLGCFSISPSLGLWLSFSSPWVVAVFLFPMGCCCVSPPHGLLRYFSSTWFMRYFSFLWLLWYFSSPWVVAVILLPMVVAVILLPMVVVVFLLPRVVAVFLLPTVVAVFLLPFGCCSISPPHGLWQYFSLPMGCCCTVQEVLPDFAACDVGRKV